jgi:hypothetical protein
MILRPDRDEEVRIWQSLPQPPHKKAHCRGRATRIDVTNADCGHSVALKPLDASARYSILHSNFSSEAFFSQKLSKHSSWRLVERCATGDTANERLALPLSRPCLDIVTLLDGG